MTTVKLGGDAAGGYLGLDISAVWPVSQSVYHTSAADVVGFTGGDLVFEGSGLGGLDDHGYATTGTVTKFSIFVPDLSIKFTDFSAGADQLEHIFKIGNSDALLNLLLGGDDQITCNPGGGQAGGYGGNDLLKGKEGDDDLRGGDGQDLLKGNNGDDLLVGDRGADTLAGAAGADTFEYNLVSDSNKANTDTITDLDDAADTIDLRGVDANVGSVGDQDFVRVASFGGHAAELIVVFDSGHHRTSIKGDVDGDGKPDLVIHADGDHSEFDNFML